MNGAEGTEPRSFPDGRPEDEQPDWRQDFPTDVPEDEAVARREFTKFLVLTSGGLAAGQCWIGLASLLARREAMPEVRVARLEGVPVGGVVEFRYPDADHPCLLIRTGEEALVAYGQQCTHLSCAVVPEIDEGRLRCPCHHGYFALADGRAVSGPPRRPLPRVQLEVRDGEIFARGVELRTT
jgi:Rieske Fe-S protein